MRLAATYLALTMGLFPLAGLAQQEEEPSAHHPEQGTDSRDKQPGTGQSQELLREMDEHRQRMRSATTPEERAQAMQEHRKAMREMMDEMMSNGARSEGTDSSAMAMHGNKNDGKKSGMSMGMVDMGDGEMGCMMGKMMKSHKMTEERLQKMEKRIGMMEQLMMNMMDSEDAEGRLEGH